MWTWNESDFVAQPPRRTQLTVKNDLFSNESERLENVPEGSALAWSWIYITLVVFVFIAGKKLNFLSVLRGKTQVVKNGGNEACYFVHNFPFLDPQLVSFYPVFIQFSDSKNQDFGFGDLGLICVFLPFHIRTRLVTYQPTCKVKGGLMPFFF